MMKNIRKRLLISMFLMLIGILMAGGMTVSAATVPKKVHISPGTADFLYLTDIASGDKIKNIKTSSKNLVARFNGRLLHREENSDQLYTNMGISLYAKKTGQYKISFDLCNSKGKVKKKCKVDVYAYKNQPFKSIKYDNMALSETYQKNIASKANGKLTVTMNSGYKLKKIRISTKEDHVYGVLDFKTVKNGSRIHIVTITKPDVHTRGSLESGDFEDYVWDSLFACTCIEIQYVDKYTKETCTVVRYLYFPQYK